MGWVNGGDKADCQSAIQPTTSRRYESGDDSHSLRIRIRSEHFHVAAMFVEQRDGFGHLPIAHVAVAINEEEILPGLALAGTRLDLGHVDAVTAEGSQRAIQRADLIGDAEHEAGAVVAGCR